MLVLLSLVALAVAWTPALFPWPSVYVSGPAVELGDIWAGHSVSAPDDKSKSLATQYLQNLKPYILVNGVTPSASSGVRKVTTTIKSTELSPIAANETYSIVITAAGITVNAETVFGAMRAYETIAQVSTYNAANSRYEIWTYQVSDYPRYNWRGLLIDTARHYMPLNVVKRQVRALAAAKMNVLHWHLVDAETFPWQMDSLPEMAKGAYGPNYIYTSAQIREVRDYALAWGVEVYIEIDTPGHAYSWGYAYPEVRTNCPSRSSNINNVPLDASQDKTYELVEKVFAEAAEVTGSKYLHIGGDEVVTSCWSEDADCKAFMSANGLSSLGLWHYFTERANDLVPAGVTPVFWQDALDNGCPVRSDAVLQAWRDQDALGTIVKAGYKGIISGGWYLDQQIPGSSTHYAWYSTWEDFYTNEPTAGLNLSDAQAALILGGEAAMWSEGIDEADIDSFIWPRALAIAERLWSSKSVTSTSAVKPRIQQHRCTLVRRGIAAGPIGPNEPCENQFVYWTRPLE